MQRYAITTTSTKNDINKNGFIYGNAYHFKFFSIELLCRDVILNQLYMKTQLLYRSKDGRLTKCQVDLPLSADFTVPPDDEAADASVSSSPGEEDEEKREEEENSNLSPSLFALNAAFTLIPAPVVPFNVSGESLPSAEIGVALTEDDASLFPDLLTGSNRTGGGELSDEFGKNATREVRRLLNDYFRAAEEAGLHTSPFICVVQARMADGSLLPVTPPVLMTPSDCAPYIAVNSVFCDEKRLVTGVRIFNRACRLKVKVDDESLRRIAEVTAPRVTALEVWTTLPRELYDADGEVSGFVSVSPSGATFTGSDGGRIPFPAERLRCWNFPMKRGDFPDLSKWRAVGVIDMDAGDMKQLNGLQTQGDDTSVKTSTVPDFAALDYSRLQKGVRLIHNGLAIVSRATPEGISPCETTRLPSLSSPFLIYKSARWRKSESVAVGEERRVFPMIYNPLAGGYMAFSGFDVMEKGCISYDESEESLIKEESPLASDDENMIFISEPGNPHIFPSRSVVRSPGGMVVGVAPVDKNISSARIGDYPFYCITTEGAWLMKRDSGGIISVAQRICTYGAVADSPIGETDGRVEYMSVEGRVSLDGVKAEIVAPPSLSESRRMYLEWRYRLKPGERLRLTHPFNPAEGAMVSLCGIKAEGKVSRIYIEAGEEDRWLPVGMLPGSSGILRMAAASSYRLAVVEGAYGCHGTQE